MNDSIICVADDVGVRVWLERLLESEWNLECVSSSDLSRVSRLAQATGAPVVIVAVDEGDAERTIKVFEAVHKACPDASLMGVSQRISQDLLLNIMRAGARDCLITGTDADTARERIRRTVDSARRGGESGGRRRQASVTVVASASPLVDTRFFAQNFACILNEILKDETILAIDSNADPNKTFYFDNLNRVTLSDLVTRSDSIDQAFIDTALEEYAPGLRLLSGKMTPDGLKGDSGADLYIAGAQLATLFDHVVIRVNTAQVEPWLRAMGSDVDQVILVSHPTVDQVQGTEALLSAAKGWVSKDCRFYFVLDGYEKRSSIALPEIEKTVGQGVDLTLSIAWRSRLDSMNAGVPITLVPTKSTYESRMKTFIRRRFLQNAGDAPGRSFPSTLFARVGG
ncbi:response regulator receiver-like protein [Marinobacter sp. C2H3]|uniref:response regulator receiver-like protein n=1 Tax=Marinobacter sp. C2H3 TaxID=3119003 RepID=UPI00300F1CC4